MKLAKTRLKCTMEVEFLRGCLKLYIEKELYASITTDEIRESYDSLLLVLELILS
jgi:hypothetical protein